MARGPPPGEQWCMAAVAGAGAGGGAVTSSAMSTLPLIHSTAGLPRLTASSSPTLNLIPEKIKCMFFMSTVKKVESLYSKQPLNSYLKYGPASLKKNLKSQDHFVNSLRNA